MNRERRWFGVAGALIFVLALALPAAWSQYLQNLGPIDLTSARQGSTVVVDRDGRLLRAFTLPDGRWRLPLELSEVDPRYVAMLLAYEDARFYRHNGVDWRALARAGLQLV
jgi:penicillin-binding protein 1C